MPPLPPAQLPLIRRLFGVWTAAVLLFLYLPIAILVAYSFNKSSLNLHWTGFTFHWYTVLFHRQEMWDALWNSAIVAFWATILSLLLGTAAAWLSHRYRFRLGWMLRSLIYVPIVTPDVIMGVSFLILFSQMFKWSNPWLLAHGWSPLSLGRLTLVIAHTTFCFPFVTVAVDARLAGLDPALEEAAMDLGATPTWAFVTVILPQLLPAIAAGALLAFALSIDEWIVSNFVAGTTATLPIKIFGKVKVSLEPSLNAAAALLLVATTVVMLIAERLRRPAKAGRVAGDPGS
jgi:spermidine/putrescine transport system permease protein